MEKWDTSHNILETCRIRKDLEDILGWPSLIHTLLESHNLFMTWHLIVQVDSNKKPDKIQRCISVIVCSKESRVACAPHSDTKDPDKTT